MSQDFSRYRKSAQQQKKLAWEVPTVIGLLVLLGLSAGVLSFSVGNSPLLALAGGKPAEQAEAGKGKDQKSPHATAESGDAGIPERYSNRRQVGERFTVAIDPETGEMLVVDPRGSMGANATSVEGQNIALVREMMDLDQHAQASLSGQGYNWARNVVEAGMGVAYGFADLPADNQISRKEHLMSRMDKMLRERPPELRPMQRFDQLRQFLTQNRDTLLTVNVRQPLSQPSSPTSGGTTATQSGVQTNFTATSGGGMLSTASTPTRSATETATAPTSTQTVDTQKVGSFNNLVNCTLGGGTCQAAQPVQTATTPTAPTGTTATAPVLQGYGTTPYTAGSVNPYSPSGSTTSPTAP